MMREEGGGKIVNVLNYKARDSHILVYYEMTGLFLLTLNTYRCIIADNIHSRAHVCVVSVASFTNVWNRTEITRENDGKAVLKTEGRTNHVS